jgi:EAL domain-containing protein (putative c-di-GMP-specific phosphodiesterase class I)
MLGCDKAQGYHIARPLPMNALMNWLDSRRDAAKESMASPQMAGG